ncbi:toll/interleukin-1 receptor domain-containing protein [Mycolicibacterium litorale]|uniref:toll/interleukin-1 receptor domain-containing protein n=1 Tax=Mycolicibacterium litorale TaxID=758802 RepID=UPI003CEFF34A
MRTAFISYARANKRDVDQLVAHLTELGCQTWVDSWLRGGQDWWDEILRQIAECDVFIPIISAEGLNSVACAREFDWAEALGKPILPVAVEPPSSALPRRYSRRQIIDYSDPADRDRAARRLAGGLLGLPPTPRTPVPRPQPPAAPLSYLTDLVDLVSSRTAITHDQQRQVLLRLEPALRSVDPEERRGGHAVLERFSGRDDLFADVDRSIATLKRIGADPRRNGTTEPQRHPPSATSRPPQSTGPQSTARNSRAPAQASGRAVPRPSSGAPSDRAFSRANLGLPATLLSLAAITGAIPPIVALGTDYDYPIEIWYSQTVSRALIGAAFAVLAVKGARASNRTIAAVGWCMFVVAVLHVVNDIVVLNTDDGTELDGVLSRLAYPALLGLAALLAVAMGSAVLVTDTVAWAGALVLWGLCGLVEAFQSYTAKVDTTTAPAADSVLVVQNLILLAAAVLMYRASNSARTLTVGR